MAHQIIDVVTPYVAVPGAANPELLAAVRETSEDALAQVPGMAASAGSAAGTTAGTVAATQAIADNPDVIAQAAALAQSDAGLVRRVDMGAPVSQPMDEWAWHVLNRSAQTLGGWLTDGRACFTSGVRFGAQTMVERADSGMSRVSVDSTTRIGEDALQADGTVPLWVLRRWLSRAGVEGFADPRVLTVRPSPGEGEYASPKLANDAADGVTPTLIVVHPGVYMDVEWVVKPRVHILGTHRDLCRLEGALPASATDQQVSGTSTIWLQGDATLENLTITARNMRYAVHSESGGAVTDYTHRTINCWIEHYGNQEVIDYRAANSLPAGSPWSSDRAWGYGASSGGHEEHEQTVFVSRRDAWYIHSREGWTRPTSARLHGCRLVTRSAAPTALVVQDLGSGQTNRVLIDASECAFDFVDHSDSPWLATANTDQVADHAETDVVIAGSEPIGYRTSARGQALRITSASTGASSNVTVSGTGAAALMGQETRRAGGGGLAAYCYGQWDISGIADTGTVRNTLGRLLGDCSTTPKTLAVTIDGASPISVTFSADMAAVDNATILSQINTALGTAGTADAYLVAQGEHYPSFPDRQASVINAGTVGIPRWAPVKWAGRQVTLMAPGDPASLLAGISVEAIPPGALGRILTHGLLLTATQMNGISAFQPAGTPIYLGGTPGSFSTTGTTILATTTLPGWARF